LSHATSALPSFGYFCENSIYAADARSLSPAASHACALFKLASRASTFFGQRSPSSWNARTPFSVCPASSHASPARYWASGACS